MKFLSGTELARTIKLQQARKVKTLNVQPKLAIVQVKDDPVIATYVGLKQKYGADIGAKVDIHTPKQADVFRLIEKLNADNSVHAIIVQLPLPDTSQTDEVVNMVAPYKDVDGLGQKPNFQPATPMAILWLLEGNGINLKDKKILLVGHGRLVGAPLEKMLKAAGHDPQVVSRPIDNLEELCQAADVIITATGSHGVISAEMLKPGTVVVDAGVAIESGVKVGDLAPDVYERDDLIITPQKGGVGPLTVCALFENVLTAAEASL